AVLALVIVVAGIRSRGPTIPVVDTATEAKVATERQLRLEANQFLHDGNVEAATTKFGELGKIAPKSPYVLGVNTKLAELRRQSETKQQQIDHAKQLFDQGMVLFNDKQYADAVKAFEASFHLNPNSDDTANYLKLAQQEDERARAEAARANPVLKSNTTTTTTAGITTTPPTTTRSVQTRPQPGSRTAQITTTFA